MPAVPPPVPVACLSLGVTGHRATHPAWIAGGTASVGVAAAILSLIAEAVAAASTPVDGSAVTPLPVRLHTLLAEGTDQALASEALGRGWSLVAPLPFGQRVNRAINAAPLTAADARRVLAGELPLDPDARTRVERIDALCGQATCFELADDDPEIAAAWLARLDHPDDPQKTMAYEADCARRVALAGRLLVEQSDLLIAIWDGASTSRVGGTGHTVATALALGGTVIWIDALAPQDWRILTAPEALQSLRAAPPAADREQSVRDLVTAALKADSGGAAAAPGKGPRKPAPHEGAGALDGRYWRARSSRIWHGYRRIEALFGGGSGGWRNLRQTYEPPDEAACSAGSGAQILAAAAALPGADPGFAGRIASEVLTRQAWADAISSHLSDCYRGGMVISFVLSACAVIAGLAYLPLVDTEWKWPFALTELVLLCAILGITALGQSRDWHRRWFETRRVAEYLRHGPILLALGAARAPGRWPRGDKSAWPEHYARQALRSVGLPETVVTAPYLRAALTDLLDRHVVVQRDYHRAKAHRLHTVHHRLDTLSERLFQLAVVAVAIYLLVAGLGTWHLIDKAAFKEASKVFTFLGVALPTLGGAIAGIRYFGDFERFAAISQTTAARLDAVHDRITILLQAPDADLDYGPVADLAHAADEIVFSEIESWQAVFGGKKITVPV